MIRWAVIFLLTSIISGITGLTAASQNEEFIAKFAFFVFTVLSAAGFVLGTSLNKKEIKSNSHFIRHK